jgi:peroxiredoxin
MRCPPSRRENEVGEFACGMQTAVLYLSDNLQINLNSTPHMKTKLLTAIAVASLLLSSQCGFTADTNSAGADLRILTGKINAKLQANTTEKDLAPELKEFDALLEKYKGQKTDEVAQILFMKGMLYMQLDDTAKGVASVKQLKADFPDTKLGQNADEILASMAKQEEAKKIQRTLVEGTKFPDFDEKDVAGNPLSIANYKGKVVLIDFWATWCGPCKAELPNVLKTYQAHHGQGFEIIGISLDKDGKALTDFTKDKNMTWQQFFDGQYWSNKLAVKYGVNSIPATYLLDGDGKIIGKNLRGPALEAAVSEALAKNKP